jgi:hypothetical protein
MECRPVEVISLSDMDRAADLLARFCESLGEEEDLRPLESIRGQVSPYH